MSRSPFAESAAFREAALRSEVRRAYAVIGIVGMLAAVLAMRPSIREVDPRLVIVGGAGLGVLMVVQFASLAFVRWARRHGRGVPAWFLIVSTVAEALIPTGMLLSHIVEGALPAYTSLVSPPVLAYGIMICLTTLRLRVWLCLLAGFVCAGGYAGLLLYVVRAMGLDSPTTGLPFAAYVNIALMLALSGAAAAWVAREVRSHLAASLDEAAARGRMEADLAVAQSIQRALLPRGAPKIAGYEVAGWNRPADQTGGDYYDWQQLPDGAWIVTLADVAGHGIGPAMVTAACRAYMRASSVHHRDLGALTSRINALLAEDLPDGRFVTMVSVLIPPEGETDGRMALLSAGHGPIVLYVGKTGDVQDIMPQDLPLAIEPSARYGPAEPVVLGEGDVLALVTDGFVEWAKFDGGVREEFGMERLRDALRRHAHLPPREIIDAITADVGAFAGTEKQQDDLTMVVIKRGGQR